MLTLHLLFKHNAVSTVIFSAILNPLLRYLHRWVLSTLIWHLLSTILWIHFIYNFLRTKAPHSLQDNQLYYLQISITSSKLLSQQYHKSLNPQYISNMDNLKNYLHKIKNAIYQNTQQTIENLKQALASDKIGKNETNQNISQVSLQQKQLQQQSRIIDQKVLEIDVIQSGYIPKTQENIAPLTLSKHQVQLSARSKENQRHKSNPSPSRLRNIEQQKKAILQELKEIDSQIAEIKGENVVDVTVKRKEKEEESEQAKKKAKELVRQLKVQKKQLQQKKRKEAQKSLLAFKQQEEDFKKKREEQLLRAKQDRRKAIQARMQEQRRKRQQRKLIDKESNKLIKQLKKEEQIIKLKEELPHEVSQLQLKKKVIIKKQDVNFRQIQDHERKYMIMKEQERSAKKQRAESVDHHVPKYPKNMWIQQIQEQEFKRREEEKIKDALKKIQLQKRKKYGELVKNIFIPKMKKQTFTQQMNDKYQEKPHTPEAVMLPKIAQSDKRVTDSKPMRKFMQQNRPFATAHHKPPKPQQIKKKQKQPQDEQRERQKKMKQAELRRQTKQRLKKLENRSVQTLPKSKPKYENYLGQIKSKLGNEAQSWKKVIENDNLSKEQKYKQMVRRAQALQNKAKVKEQMRKNGDQDALNLYIGSIQAKLAILQKF